MRTRGRAKTLALWIGLPALAGVVAVSLFFGIRGKGDEGESGSGARAGAGPTSVAAWPPVAVVWGVENARRAARRLARSEAVERTSVIRRGTTLLRSAGNSDGRTVQRVRSGFGIPLDVVSVDPRDYGATLPAAERRRVTRLGRGEALLSRTSARLRRIGTGGSLRLVGDGRLRVVGVVPDALAQSAELLVGNSEGLPSARDSVVAVLREGAEVSTIELARAAGGDARARLIGTVSGGREAAPSRRGPARPAELKDRFGEPAVALPYTNDRIRLDAGFLRRNIVTRRVPILGAVSCHRKMLPALRAAMRELDSQGLGRLVDTGDYAGCYAPRRIRPGGALSLHAWGLAVDLNASANPFGGRSSQDPRLVAAMRRHGFTWGGRFPTRPDPMHFEFRGR
jgi:hypothetical protein